VTGVEKTQEEWLRQSGKDVRISSSRDGTLLEPLKHENARMHDKINRWLLTTNLIASLVIKVCILAGSVDPVLIAKLLTA